MAHFAKIDSLGVVTFVTAGRDEDDGKELELSARTGDTYRQTSFNTKSGVYYDPNTNLPHVDQSKAFRKNFAGVGYTYDPVRDAFIPPKPFASWVLDETTCQWEAPVAMPTDGQMYSWDEATTSWKVNEPAQA